MKNINFTFARIQLSILQTPRSILKQYWNYDQFRPQQEEIIQYILDGNDALGVLPTGGGKSICYQVPALILKGSCIVVSPLIALMKDQVLGLHQRGIKSLVVHSGMHNDEVREVYELMSLGQAKFLFVSPERLKSVLFLDYLQDWKISMIAVDEAHCISQWGYDFRPAYLDISMLREFLPNVPVLALTASATPLVQQDIVEKLQFKNGEIFFTTFARPNISFSSFSVENKLIKTVDILQKLNGSSLVYCKNRKRTKEIAESLIAAGLSADYYHAGLEANLRAKKQEDWIDNKIRIIVCTNAFGMGIDKADVRCVIHYDIPDTPENYYQEAGRAGRDGEKSYAVLLYQQRDLNELQSGITLKYPAIDTIRNIYEGLAYYFQVALYDGLETMYEFDVLDFSNKFKFNLIEVLSSIKILEQQGYWTLSDSVFLPSKISVTCAKEDIEQLEKLQPDLDEILKFVLRMYSGIFYQYVPIRELQIAQQARVSVDYVQQILRKLHTIGMIDYIESKDQPQLFYLHDRVPKNKLRIDIAFIEMLRKRYEERVSFMIDYATQQTTCRATMLMAYFKEKSIDNCQCCDVCLAAKQSLNEKENFIVVRNNIFNEIELCGSINIDLFCQKYSSLQQTNVLNVIRFLIDDGQLKLNEKGDLIKA